MVLGWQKSKKWDALLPCRVILGDLIEAISLKKDIQGQMRIDAGASYCKELLTERFLGQWKIVLRWGANPYDIFCRPPEM